MSDIRTRGSQSQMVRLFIPDNSVTTGAGVTGLTFESTNLRISYIREFDSALVSYTGANIETITTIGTYQAPSSSSKCRFKETPIPGVYEIHFHNSATIFGTADASNKVQVLVAEDTTTALKIGPNTKEIQLIAANLQDSVRAGLTALPNAAADAAGGLPISDAGGLDLDAKVGALTYTVANKLDANILAVSGNSTVVTTLLKSLGSMRVCTVDDTAFEPTATEFETSDITEAQANKLLGRCILFTSGDCILQAVWIQAYALASGRGHFTVDALVAIPADADEFIVI